MSLAASRDAATRIRILTCEPLPAAPEAPRRPVGVIALVVALLAVSATLAVRSATPEAPVAVSAAAPVEAMGTVHVTAFRQTRKIHRWMRSSVTADFDGAARIAARNRQREAVAVAVPPSTPAVASSAPAGTTYSAPRTPVQSAQQAPAQQAPAQQSAPRPQAPSVQLDPDAGSGASGAGPQWPHG